MVQAEATQDREPSPYPDGLSPARHRDDSRSGDIWARRTFMALLVAVVAIAATGAAGQTTGTVTSGPLHVTSPGTVRGGLLYEILVDVRPVREIHSPVIAISDPIWESLSVNSIVPDASDDGYQNGAVELSYSKPIPAGGDFRVRIYFQANPGVAGVRHGQFALRDGTTPLARVDRRLVVLP